MATEVPGRTSWEQYRNSTEHLSVGSLVAALSLRVPTEDGSANQQPPSLPTGPLSGEDGSVQ
jgi:hypothetical protein